MSRVVEHETRGLGLSGRSVELGQQTMRLARNDNGTINIDWVEYSRRLFGLKRSFNNLFWWLNR
jgi:hypothetical protein